MESDKEKQIFPPPPDYFKEFTSPNKYSPPKLSYINKMDKLITFGSEYATKEMNISYNPINIDTVGDKLLKASKARNVDLFRSIKNDIDKSLSSDSFKNLIDEIEKEIYFLKSRYEKILEDIGKDIKKAGNRNKIALIGLTLQKINFYLIALRRKAVLKKTIDFYEKEIQDCEKTSNNVENNIKNFRIYLEDVCKQLMTELNED